MTPQTTTSTACQFVPALTGNPLGPVHADAEEARLFLDNLCADNNKHLALLRPAATAFRALPSPSECRAMFEAEYLQDGQDTPGELTEAFPADYAASRRLWLALGRIAVSLLSGGLLAALYLAALCLWAAGGRP